MANKEALDKVLAHITENPRQWDQLRWTTCFAGWTLRLCMPGVETRKDEIGMDALYWDESRVPPHDIRDWAASLLGLDSEQAFTLFDMGNELDDVTRLVGKFTAPAAVPA